MTAFKFGGKTEEIIIRTFVGKGEDAGYHNFPHFPNIFKYFLLPVY